jgi:hypothetical protein
MVPEIKPKNSRAPKQIGHQASKGLDLFSDSFVLVQDCPQTRVFQTRVYRSSHGICLVTRISVQKMKKN